MLYARIVLGLPVEGPFDYLVPEQLCGKIKIGMRAWVSFGTRRMVGYVAGLQHQTSIKNIKTISELIDESPVLDRDMLLLTKELSDYYCCSWGEAIEASIPEDLRKGKKFPSVIDSGHKRPKGVAQETLIHGFLAGERWDNYLKAIKEALNNRKSAILLLPDIPSLLSAQEKITAGLGIAPALLYRKQPGELETWLKIKKQEIDIVAGTRAAVFAPLHNLGLIIIDEENDPVYKQDQVPHYHAREVAAMRIKIGKARLILGSSAPSLESFYLSKREKIGYTLLPKINNFPEIKIVDTTRQRIRGKVKEDLARYTVDSIGAALKTQGKVLIFLNRKGFATFAYCHNCGVVLRCPRCNINLVYYFKDNILSCRYCNFKMQPPNICPQCNGGYIKYSGLGTEKIESELARIFPAARIKRWEKPEEADLKDTDILVSTQHILRQASFKFDLIAVVSIDNSLNRIDFRAAEKTFGLLTALTGLTDKSLIIQTRLGNHHCFRALLGKDANIFYDEELRQRKQLNFPPFRHLGLVKLRGRNEAKVRQASESLFEKLRLDNKDKNIKIISVNPGHPLKLRGNFYWQVLLESATPRKISKFLKNSLRKFSHSGIIVTVDIDPV